MRKKECRFSFYKPANPLSSKKDISQETRDRLSSKVSELVCPRCLTYCAAHSIQLRWNNKIEYYGCRICKQSQEFVEVPNGVEIIQASNEEIERFAVQVGNDTDETRRHQYKKMECFVPSDCGLSANTIRIVQSIFGEVKRWVNSSQVMKF
ncbi:MAG: hypothetical protein KDJ65_23990 [Anaerolineae bacterium]|nr:hypothetical protein [Anaerolineae bacterium]